MRMKIDAPRFVREWALAPSVDVVAERMGMTRGAVMIYASKLRKLGVKMKSFKHVDTKQIDVAALNTVIDEVQGGASGNEAS
jgi:hypothetical protein